MLPDSDYARWMAVDMDAAQFDRLVDAALDSIPAGLLELIENCVVLVEDYPPPDAPGLLGLYDGVPLTERGESYAGALPDRILIFRVPILELCRDRDEVVREVQITVVHEVAHHFGIADDRLHDLGYA